MGYLFLSLALLAGLTKGFCGKKSSGYVSLLSDAVLMNVVRMLFCIVIGFFFVLFDSEGLAALALSRDALPIVLCSALANSFFIVLWMVTVRRGAYMVVDVFLSGGVLVPLILSYFAFGDPIPVFSWIGVAMLVVAVSIMCSYNSQIKTKTSFGTVLLLIATGITCNLSSFTQKWRAKAAEGIVPGDVPNAVYNFYTFAISAILLFLVWVVMILCARRRDPKRGLCGRAKGKPVIIVLLPYIAVMAPALFLHSFFSSQAAVYLSSAEQYPLMQGASMILSLLMAHFAFGEKIKPRCLFGIALTALALFVMNILPGLL